MTWSGGHIRSNFASMEPISSVSPPPLPLPGLSTRTIRVNRLSELINMPSPQGLVSERPQTRAAMSILSSLSKQNGICSRGQHRAAITVPCHCRPRRAEQLCLGSVPEQQENRFASRETEARPVPRPVRERYPPCGPCKTSVTLDIPGPLSREQMVRTGTWSNSCALMRIMPREVL